MKTRLMAVLALLTVGGLLLASSAAQTTTTQTTTTQVAPSVQTPPNPPSGEVPGSSTGQKLNVGPGSHETGHSWENHVNTREQDQQNRIANGIKNGQLSSGQAAHLENRENQIQEREAKDESEHGGHLTPQEKQHFQRAQNKMSKQIHNDKHPK